MISKLPDSGFALSSFDYNKIRRRLKDNVVTCQQKACGRSQIFMPLQCCDVQRSCSYQGPEKPPVCEYYHNKPYLALLGVHVVPWG